MDRSIGDKRLQANLDKVHALRMEWLRSLTLSRLLRHCQGSLFVLEAQSAPDIINQLLLLDKSAFETRAALMTLVRNMKPQELMSDYPTTYRVLYEQERAKAVNRFTLEFLNEFAGADGGIDWEKLLRFNSGKEAPVRAVRPKTRGNTDAQA